MTLLPIMLAAIGQSSTDVHSPLAASLSLQRGLVITITRIILCGASVRLLIAYYLVVLLYYGHAVLTAVMRSL